MSNILSTEAVVEIRYFITVPPELMLGDFEGTLMTDGYDCIAKANKSITHLGCWAHARRYLKGKRSFRA
ncbi:MAG: transposase [Colwellia sp.]